MSRIFWPFFFTTCHPRLARIFRQAAALATPMRSHIEVLPQESQEIPSMALT